MDRMVPLVSHGIHDTSSLLMTSTPPIVTSVTPHAHLVTPCASKVEIVEMTLAQVSFVRFLISQG
jgi:hypothetical protein